MQNGLLEIRDGDVQAIEVNMAVVELTFEFIVDRHSFALVPKKMPTNSNQPLNFPQSSRVLPFTASARNKIQVVSDSDKHL
jgi:hypothetical protein